MPVAGILSRSRLRLYVGRMEGFGVQGMPCTCDLGRAEEPQQAAPSLRHSMPVAGILRRSRLLLYVGRMEGFGVQGMPCTCDLGRAEEPQQAAPSLRHSMPGAGILRRSRLLLYVGRMEGFGVQGMPCTCDLGCAEEPQQAAAARAKSAPPPDLDRPAFVHALGGGDRHPQALGRFGDIRAGCGATPQAVEKVAQFRTVGLGEARAV
jgi:hypothetical protein